MEALINLRSLIWHVNLINNLLFFELFCSFKSFGEKHVPPLGLEEVSNFVVEKYMRE